jgi:uncharacterized protein involved in response to NO
MTEGPSPPAGPAVLSAGFRPFFLLAGLSAMVNIALSLLVLQGMIGLPIQGAGLSWHFHEMMFGTVAAAVTGFLLTAVPNWTGRLPIRGRPLLVLVVLWLAGRGVMIISLWIGPGIVAIVDLAFLSAVFLLLLREILAGRNWRNLPVLLAVLVFLLSNVLFHLEAAAVADLDGLSQRLAVSAVVGLLSLIGGRITPSFTRNWLVKRAAVALPAAFGPRDKAALVCGIAALLAWTLNPVGPITAGFAALAALANALRLARWRGYLTVAEPLLLSLHLGYAWIVIGFAFIGLAAVLPDGWHMAALHALTAGAMGTMMLAVMSRATLGHTGRPLTAGAGLSLAYALITLAAVTRVIAAPLFEFHGPLVMISAGTWIAAFGCFLIACGPALIGPVRRAPSDERPDYPNGRG